MINRLSKNVYYNIYGILSILFIWTMLHIYVGENMVPSPAKVLETFINMPKRNIYLHIGYSFYRIISSVILAILIGIPIGILIGINKKVRNILSPIIYLLYPIPKIAFLPIFMVLFGIGDKSKILLMITIIIFQIIISTRDAVLQIDDNILIASKLMKFNILNVCYHVIFPSIAPKLFSALRISIGISISALFFSENYATKYGIGYFIMNSWSMVDYNEMFVGIIILSIISLLIYKTIDFIEKIVCPWNY